MSPRERGLLALLGVSALVGIVLFGSSAFLDEASRLDAELLQVIRLSGQSRSRVPEGLSVEQMGQFRDWESRMETPDSLPPMLDVARTVQDRAKESGLVLVDLQVVRGSEKSPRVKATFRGSATAWLSLVRGLQKDDPKLVYQSVTLNLTERRDYSIDLEVNHAVRP